MRRLALALCLLAPAAAAQPTAADSALVERLLTALRFELAEEVLGEIGEGVAGQVEAESPGAAPLIAPFLGALTDTGPLVDSVRAAFLADLRPDLVREALAALEGPAMQRALERSPFQPGQFDYAQMMALLEDPGSRPLADSALAARYADALMAANQPPDLQRRTTQALWDAFPTEVQAAIRESVGKEAFFELTATAQTGPEHRAVMVRAARISLGALPEADVRALTAYYESEAGRYVQGTAAEGTANAMIPRMVEGMRPAFKALVAQTQSGPPPGRWKGPDGDPLGAPTVFEVAEVEPELVGGIEALQRNVEYPEAARRAGIEGRVIVQFVVDEKGRVVDPVAVRSPDPLLSEAALAAVRGARFTPGRDGGAAVKVRFSIPVTFRLADPEPAAEGPEVEEIELDLAAAVPPPRPPARPAPPPPPPDPAEPEIYEVAEVEPVLVGGPAALAARVVYPEAARAEGVGGLVIVQFVVSPEGAVVDPVDVLRSPDPRLSEAAVAAVRGLRFEPGRQRGRPVHVRTSLPVRFED